MTRGLIDTRLSSRLEPSFYPDAVTIQTASIARGSAGSQVKTWADDPDRTDLPCRIAPTGEKEVKRSDQIFTRTTHRIGLSEDFGITTNERAVSGSLTFDIVLVETDSQGHATYLDVEVVT